MADWTKGYDKEAVQNALTENYTYQELFAPGQWHSDKDAAYRSSLVGTPKPLNLDETKTGRGEYANPTWWYDDPDSVAAVQESQIAKIGADIVEDYKNLQEEALADIGVFEWDEEAATEDALAIIQPFFEEEFKSLEEDIKEQRLRSAEEYSADLKEITETAQAELKKLDITEAENEQELLARLDAVGAREEYEKAEQGRIMAEAVEDLQLSLEDIQGRAGFLTEEQQAAIAKAEEDYRQTIENIEGREDFEVGEKQRLIREAEDKLNLTLRDIRGKEEYGVAAQERIIQEAEETLQRKLGDIGARKAYSYAKAKQEWDTRIAKEEETQLGRGRGYSGVMREEIGKLDLSKVRDLGEILRSYAVEENEALASAEFTKEEAQANIEEIKRSSGIETERAGLGTRYTREEAEAGIGEIERQVAAQREAATTGLEYTRGRGKARIGEIERAAGVGEAEARAREKYTRLGAEAKTGEIERLAEQRRGEVQREAMFTQERTQAAREEVEAQKARGVTAAETEMRRGVRAYGYGTPYEEIPENVRPAEEVPERGVYGQRSYAELQREKEEAKLAQVNKLLEQRREEYGMARELALEGVPEYPEYYETEFGKRKKGYGL